MLLPSVLWADDNFFKVIQQRLNGILEIYWQTQKTSVRMCNECVWFQHMGPAKFLCVSILFTETAQTFCKWVLNPLFIAEKEGIHFLGKWEFSTVLFTLLQFSLLRSKIQAIHNRERQTETERENKHLSLVLWSLVFRKNFLLQEVPELKGNRNYRSCKESVGKWEWLLYTGLFSVDGCAVLCVSEATDKTQKICY